MVLDVGARADAGGRLGSGEGGGTCDDNWYAGFPQRSVLSDERAVFVEASCNRNQKLSKSSRKLRRPTCKEAED